MKQLVKQGKSLPAQMALAAALVLMAACASGSPLNDAIAKDYDYLGKLFKHFHANPELSMQEFATSDRLAEELQGLGFSVTRKIGGTGLVGILKNGDGPTRPDQFTPWYQSDMGAEDFPDLVGIDPPIPSVYFEVGGTPADKLISGKWAGHHSPLFQIDAETSIRAGVEAMTLAALELLKPAD